MLLTELAGVRVFTYSYRDAWHSYRSIFFESNDEGRGLQPD